jgi:hypothetical protein
VPEAYYFAWTDAAEPRLDSSPAAQPRALRPWPAAQLRALDRLSPAQPA